MIVVLTCPLHFLFLVDTYALISPLQKACVLPGRLRSSCAVAREAPKLDRTDIGANAFAALREMRLVVWAFVIYAGLTTDKFENAIAIFCVQSVFSSTLNRWRVECDQELCGILFHRKIRRRLRADFAI